MEDKQPVSTTCSVTAARLAQSTIPALGEGRSVAFPPPEPETVQVATTPVPEPKLTVEVRGHPIAHWTFGGMCCSRLTIIRLHGTALVCISLVQPVKPSLSASSGDLQSTVHTEHFALGPLLLQYIEKKEARRSAFPDIVHL